MTARLIECSPDDYHLRPGFSASVAAELISTCEAKAKVKRDRRRDISKMSDEMIRGAVIHHLVLGKGARFEPCPFDDYKTKAAQTTRDSFFAAGIIPVITHKLEKYRTAAQAIRQRIAEAGIVLDGESEVAIEWDEDGLLCRCMIDHLKGGHITELKIPENAHPDTVESRAESMGYRIAAAAYVRALLALKPELVGQISYTFVFAEPEEPYACYAPDAPPIFLERGERDWLNACRRWKECERTGVYPHYQNYQTISPPRWKLRQEGYRDDEW